jgi:hypothetical protein
MAGRSLLAPVTICGPPEQPPKARRGPPGAVAQRAVGSAAIVLVGVKVMAALAQERRARLAHRAPRPGTAGFISVTFPEDFVVPGFRTGIWDHFNGDNRHIHVRQCGSAGERWEADCRASIRSRMLTCRPVPTYV